MIRRQSSNQSSDGIAANTARPPKNPSAKLSHLLVDYLPKGQTINADYYSSLLVQLKDIFKEKGCVKVTKVVLLLHDNAPAHRALATQKKLAYLGFQCLDHPSYYPDLPRRTTTCSLD